MRPNIVTEAGIGTRVGQWWESIPFVTSGVVFVCGTIYLLCLFIGYDSFYHICFLPSAILSSFQVYRIYTSVVFHGSLLHVLFNMMAMVPLGSALERIMGSVRLCYIMVLLATTNALLNLVISVIVAYNPFVGSRYFLDECAIGFSGILFSMIVIETSLSGVQSRSVFGLFNVPAKWYAFILLVVFQLLMTNVSLLGHLCGILSGFAYVYGLLNILIPGSSLYSAIESSSFLSFCVRRPKFIMCTGGNSNGYIPTHSSQSTTSSGLFSGNMWRNLSSWIPQREASGQAAGPTQDTRFPGRGRTLGLNQTQPAANSDSNLQTRLLDSATVEHSSDLAATGRAEQPSDRRRSALDNPVTASPGDTGRRQGPVAPEEHIQKLIAMGFEKTQVEVALAAADGDINVAVEILMSQQG